MIFSSFRESVQEIADMLNRHAPKIKVMTFMGQASAGKGVKGFTQKEQLEVEYKGSNMWYGLDTGIQIFPQSCDVCENIKSTIWSQEKYVETI